MIRIDRPFFLYANASIEYHGRAKSTLKLGNYVVIHKGDGTLLIHGDNQTIPLNYQRPKSILTINENELLSVNGDEKIKINLRHIIHYCEMPGWSSHIIEINMTEDDLRNKIVDDIHNYVNDDDIKEVIKEFKTPYGPIDIVAINTSDLYYVIEVKRGKANVNACTQLCKYLGYFDEIKIATKGLLMCPEVTKGAAAYCQRKNLCWVSVEH